MAVMQNNILYTEKQIQDRVLELAKEIHYDYRDKDLVIVGVLNGCLHFLSDLCLKIKKIDIEIDTMAIRSYEENIRTGITLLKNITTNIKGKHVIILDDIVESGETIKFVKFLLQTKDPKSIEICTLINRSDNSFKIKYSGFDLEAVDYLVGYGLDTMNKERNLPYIYIK